MIALFLLVNVLLFLSEDSAGHQVNFMFPRDEYLYQDCIIPYYQKEGVCVEFTLCESAQFDWRSKGIQPTTCYFEKFDHFVCCESSSPAQDYPYQSAPNPTRPRLPQSPQPPKRTPPEIDTTQENDSFSNPIFSLPLISEPEPKPKSRISQRNCEANYAKEVDFGNVAFISVVGGEEAGKDEFPYMAALGWRRSDGSFAFNCGGFLVSNNFVVTAAHCSSLGGAPPDVVRIGGDSLNLNTSDPDIPIERVFVHPNYDRSQIYNDIALIKMTQSSEKIHACLWLYDDILANYTMGTAIGYGDTQFAGIRSNTLMKVDLLLVSHDQCKDSYKPQSDFPMGLINSQLCAGDPAIEKDTCQGDSGGPLLIRSFYKTPFVVGLTSFGAGCAGGTPSIYTKISSYIDWIESVVWPGL